LDALEQTIDSVYYPATATSLDDNKVNFKVFSTNGKIVVDCDTETEKPSKFLILMEGKFQTGRLLIMLKLNYQRVFIL